MVLELKYFPNKDGQARVGWRTVLPLDLYSYRGVLYMLGWQSDGASVSGGSGYRLFFTRNIQEYKPADTTSLQPFAMAQIAVSAKVRSKEIKVRAWYMIKTGQVE